MHMHNDITPALLKASYFSSINQNWIENLYHDFLINPNLIDANWRFVFQQITDMKVKSNSFNSKTTHNHFNYLMDLLLYSSSATIDFGDNAKHAKVSQLINAYRFYGYQNANLDPLGLWKQGNLTYLDPSYHHLTREDFQKKINVSSFAVGKKMMKIDDLIDMLKKTYCGSIGVEYMHITAREERYWIQERIESIAGHIVFSANEKKRFLSELTAAEGLEQYLSTKFPGAKRFSLEGGDTLIPMLKELLRYAGNSGIYEVVIGMTHRGRLNVLVNVFGKKPRDLFEEFTDKNRRYLGTGDVKYHMGFSSYLETKGGLVHLVLAFNPSHLEIINPVVMGIVRARLDHFNKLSSNKILPITIHGDAAITGQGVVQETLNMSRARGYEVGGTIRIVINNQIGFTTSNPMDARSTTYCTDIGKMVQAPIFHVNADYPEAVAFVTHLALDFRNTFRHDVFIDLVCYRRRGHNESDEPSVTQPLMYKKIKKHPTIRKIYADKLKAEKVVTLEDIANMINLYRDKLDIGDCVVKECRPMNIHSFIYPKQKTNYKQDNNSYANIEINLLQMLAQRISSVPKEIEMHPRVAKIYADRQDMAAGKKMFDWGGAENLAYATLVNEGISVRLSGEDSSRGTFFHRHAVIHNQHNGSTYTPLQHIHNKQGSFTVWDSTLSEEAVLAFEYGYATAEPRSLTIWEAQFGDFANCAQVVIDQFISSGEQKWGCTCNLVMLLPHGYEGQGPEHSSARIERYLQLCSEQNMQVCIPSTPAQIYHILRRQAVCNIRRPLIVMSPKSLLRHTLAVSSLDELANGTFLPVIGEINELNTKTVKHVIMCSGKVYYDLLKQRRKNNQENIAIIRIEQLYPFPYQEIHEVLKLYSHAHDFIWCQEEPLNQGAWCYSQNHFRKIIPFGSTLRYVGRQASASTAVGYMSVHQQQQQNLVDETLNVDFN